MFYLKFLNHCCVCDIFRMFLQKFFVDSSCCKYIHYNHNIWLCFPYVEFETFVWYVFSIEVGLESWLLIVLFTKSHQHTRVTVSRILSIPVKQNTQKTVFNTMVGGRFRLVIINVFCHVLKSFPCLLIYFACSFSDFLFVLDNLSGIFTNIHISNDNVFFPLYVDFFFLLSPTRRLTDLTIHMSNIVLAFCVVLFWFVCIRSVSRLPNVVDVSVLTLLVYLGFVLPSTINVCFYFLLVE